MKTIHLLLLFSALSLVVMIWIDYIIGAKAEFLNAFSVVQRILGQQPSVADSMVAKKLGAIGEFAVVILANFVFGGILTSIFRFFSRS
jgi:hypothetical protein